MYNKDGKINIRIISVYNENIKQQFQNENDVIPDKFLFQHDFVTYTVIKTVIILQKNKSRINLSKLPIWRRMLLQRLVCIIVNNLEEVFDVIYQELFCSATELHPSMVVASNPIVIAEMFAFRTAYTAFVYSMHEILLQLNRDTYVMSIIYKVILVSNQILPKNKLKIIKVRI